MRDRLLPERMRLTNKDQSFVEFKRVNPDCRQNHARAKEPSTATEGLPWSVVSGSRSWDRTLQIKGSEF